MHYYTIIAIVLLAVGFGLLFFLDTLIKPDTDQDMLKTVREQNMLIGAAALAGAYYMYTLGEDASAVTSSVPYSAPYSEPSDIPSYEEATSDVLNM
jgi:hypothetical protein